MGRKIENIVFSILCCLLLFSVIGYKAVDKIGATLGLSEPETFSYLDGRELSKVPEFSIQGFLNKSFQADMATYITDYCPNRDIFRVANTRGQRSVIEFASVPFGYDVYRTYYGSKLAYSKSNDAIVEIPTTADEKFTKTLEKNAKLYNNFIEKHPDYEYYFYLAEPVSISAANPTAVYLNNPVNWNTYESHFLEKIDATIITPKLHSSAESLYEDYFRTDHHWNIDGAYDAYLQIANEMGIENVLSPTGVISFDEVSMHGSDARKGLCLVGSPDHMKDYELDLPSFEVESSKYGIGDISMVVKSGELAADEERLSQHEFAGRYGECFPYVGWMKTYMNPDDVSGKNLLIIGDSFSRANERLLAAHFSKTWSLELRSAEQNLSEFLASHDVDVILFGYHPWEATQNTQALSRIK